MWLLYLLSLKILPNKIKNTWKIPSVFESDRRGSNPRPRPWQGRTLPTEPLSHLMFCVVLCHLCSSEQ